MAGSCSAIGQRAIGEAVQPQPGSTTGGSGPFERRATRAFGTTSGGPRSRNLERDGVPRPVAMAMVGQNTEGVYRRYAIVDEAMIREAAVKMDRGAKVRQTTAQSDRPSADR